MGSKIKNSSPPYLQAISYSLTDEFESLQKRVHAVYSDAPKTTDAAVKMAEEALKVNGDNTFTEKEIDMMLPATLKRRGNDE